MSCCCSVRRYSSGHFCFGIGTSHFRGLLPKIRTAGPLNISGITVPGSTLSPVNHSSFSAVKVRKVPTVSSRYLYYTEENNPHKPPGGIYRFIFASASFAFFRKNYSTHKMRAVILQVMCRPRPAGYTFCRIPPPGGCGHIR